MTIAFVDFSYVGVIAAAVVSFIIGFLWYSPMLFGKQWSKLMGFSDSKMKEAKKGMAKMMAGGFIAMLVMSFVMAQVVGFMQLTTYAQGAAGGFLVWLGFVATVILGQVLWEGKPFQLYLINSLHYLVVLVAMGVLHAVVF